MDKTIQAGDLVIVTKPRACGCADSLGVIDKVIRVERGAQLRCYSCLHVTTLAGAVIACFADGAACELWRLKRIDPLSEPSSTEHVDEVTA